MLKHEIPAGYIFSGAFRAYKFGEGFGQGVALVHGSPTIKGEFFQDSFRYPGEILTCEQDLLEGAPVLHWEGGIVEAEEIIEGFGWPDRDLSGLVEISTFRIEL